MKDKKIVILGAMLQEILAYNLQIKSVKWTGIKIYVEATGVSKTAAAATTQKVIDKYQPDAIIFTGVAGALDPELEIGDLGIVTKAIDADLDVRCWDQSYKIGEVPFTRERIYQSDDYLIELVRNIGSKKKLFNFYAATGSAFLDSSGKKKFVDETLEDLADFKGEFSVLPNVYEMECSAILQIAKSNNVPALALRVISDTFNGDCPTDFNSFISTAVDHYVGLVGEVLKNYLSYTHE